MDIDQARIFIGTHHRAVLATRHADGRAQLSPVAVALDGEGRAVVSTRETAVKARNLRRDPAAVLCILRDEFFGDWCYVAGPAEVVSLPDAMDALVEYYRSISGEHPDWDDYRAAMERERRVVLQITIERAGPGMGG